MKLITLIERLNRLGVEKISKTTIKRWAFDEKTITMPVDKHGNKFKGGRERATNWPEEALEEAAAVWAVRYINADIERNGKRAQVTPEMIGVIKRAVAILYDCPFAVYTIPSIAGPLSSRQISPEKIKMKFVSEGFDGLDLFQSKCDLGSLDCLNSLVITWVAAIEKVREWKFDGIKAQVGDLAPSQVDFSQVDPWRVTVPCPWRIDEPARVEFLWLSRPSKNKNESREFFLKAPFPLQRTLRQSDCDDILLFQNLVDTREFFRIGVTGGEGYAKAELEETARKKRSSTSPLQKMELERSEAWLKNWFGV